MIFYSSALFNSTSIHKNECIFNVFLDQEMLEKCVLLNHIKPNN